MPRETRRAVIVAAIGLGSLMMGPPSNGSTPGGVSQRSNDSDAPDPGMAAASGSTTPTPSMLSVTGRVVERATAVHPMRIRLAIENDAGRPVRLRPARRSALFHNLPRFAGPGGDLVPVPVGSDLVEAPDLASERRDGCWRFVTSEGAPARRQTVATRTASTVSSGATHAVEHELFVADGTDRCPAPGTYTTTLAPTLERADGSLPVEVSLSLRVPEAGAPTLAVEGPAG